MFKPKPLRPQNSVIIGAPHDLANQDWCVYLHAIPSADGSPPTVAYVGACRLADVFKFTDAQRNSEWRRLFLAEGAQVIVQIHSTGEKFACMNGAFKLSRSIDPMPTCNLNGFANLATSRIIIDTTTGIEYASQLAAANALNLHQSHISRHLRGELKHVQGHVFRYKNGSD